MLFESVDFKLSRSMRKMPMLGWVGEVAFE
jgi:hypothetical protein